MELNCNEGVLHQLVIGFFYSDALFVTNSHRIEEELGTTIVPGTEIMADVGTHHFMKSSSKSDRVLVPQPSQDPHDPLVTSTSVPSIYVFIADPKSGAKNWSRYWKMSSMVIVTLTTFSQGFGPLALAPMFPEMMETFNSSLSDVVQFTGVCILVLGFSNFFW
ncbi:hypothetical protein N7478_011662 [Penicillium angulare]|uniref:uncharacterized protein n=1 Tax=Penicillium angulare TaxID=116970 RepID=UPI0025413BF4|nr:uncharacterized protein N7478_011662 [Penicillium angulare]KAJ5261067.1 hypothetical protein N7478_011662 [Penicillium angulare]